MRLSLQKGVTLIEVLVAIGVFSIAIVILLTAITSSTLYTTRARNREAAMFIAKEEMENIFLMADTGDFDNIPGQAGTTGSGGDLQANFNGQVTIGVSELQYSEDYPGSNPTPSIPADGGGPVGCYEIWVDVTWNDFEWNGMRLTRSATASTYRLCSVVGRGE